MFKQSVLVLMALALSGCAIAPGMKMEDPPRNVTNRASDLKITPTFIPITAQLLQQMPENCNSYRYYVGPQDVLSIVVWDHPELTYPVEQAPTQQGVNTELSPTMTPTGYLVNPNGTIFFPLVGNVNVVGKTVDEIRAELAGLLKKYVLDPQIDVRVISYRSTKVYIMGEVNKAGVQPITDIPLSITDAINLAGGLNQDTADPSHIYVMRGNMQHPNVYWLNAGSPDALLLAEHFRLQANDIVFVSTAGVARWNRAISQIMPTIQTVFYTQASIQQFHT